MPAIKSPTESKEGAALVKMVNAYMPGAPFAHVPNENQHKKAREGVSGGYPDYILDLSFGGFHGLRIELKRRDGKPSNVSQKQRNWGQILEGNGYCWVVAYGWQDAFEKIKQYTAGTITSESKKYLPK